MLTKELYVFDIVSGKKLRVDKLFSPLADLTRWEELTSEVREVVRRHLRVHVNFHHHVVVRSDADISKIEARFYTLAEKVGKYNSVVNNCYLN